MSCGAQKLPPGQWSKRGGEEGSDRTGTLIVGKGLSP